MYPILIGCDCDPDRNGFTPGIEEHSLSWEGIEKGIESFRRERNSYFLENGIKPIVTWYVRADYQIEKVHGDAGYCLKRFYELWKKLEYEGDEIGWHPHLWDWDRKKKIWYQNINSPEFTKRGSKSEFWALYNSENHMVGSTIHIVDKGIDTGEVISQIYVDVQAEDNYVTLRAKNIKNLTQDIYRVMIDLKQGQVNKISTIGRRSQFFSTPSISQYRELDKRLGLK